MITLTAAEVRERLRTFVDGYKSQVEASQVIGISQASLSQFLNGAVQEPQRAVIHALGLEALPRRYGLLNTPPSKKRGR